MSALAGAVRIASAPHDGRARALAQRIVVRYHVDALTRDELTGYLAHRLRLASAEVPLFDPSAEEAIYQASGGLPRIEVAARLSVSRFTVRSWRLKGMGPRFLKMGRAVRYRPQDVDDYERQALVETHEPQQAAEGAS